MKATLKILALLAMVGFASQPSKGATVPQNGACGYYCGGVLYSQNVGSGCCSYTFTCPNGQQVPAWAMANSGRWWVCPVQP
jgi:hypothetical protein